MFIKFYHIVKQQCVYKLLQTFLMLYKNQAHCIALMTIASLYIMCSGESRMKIPIKRSQNILMNIFYRYFAGPSYGSDMNRTPCATPVSMKTHLLCLQ